MDDDRRRSPATQPGFMSGRVPANKGKRYPPEVLTRDEVEALIAQCGNTATGVRDQAIIAVAYRSGLRSQEIVELQVEDVDFWRHSITVRNGLATRQRVVGIDRGALNFVEAWLEERSQLHLPASAPLFCTLRGRTIWQGQLRKKLQLLGHRAGIEKHVHLHGLRHTFAFELVSEETDITIIQKQLGLADIQHTVAYLSHIAPLWLADTMRERDW